MSLRRFHLGPWAFSAQAKVVTSGSRKCLLGQLENCSALRSAFSRGSPARNRVVLINSGGMRRREGKAPENRASLTWPYFCVPCDCLSRRADGPLQAPLLDENHPISGRSPHYKEIPSKMRGATRMRSFGASLASSRYGERRITRFLLCLCSLRCEM